MFYLCDSTINYAVFLYSYSYTVKVFFSIDHFPQEAPCGVFIDFYFQTLLCDYLR